MTKKKDSGNWMKAWIDEHYIRLVAGLLIILILVSGAYFLSPGSDPEATIDISDELNDKQWVMFSMMNCPACEQQKEILGTESAGIIIIECDASKHHYDRCKENNITLVPTWINLETRQRIEGVQTLEMIEEMLNDS